MDTRVPVTLIAGFLGSGKTTLINTLLQGDHGLNITVLVNDFGAVNIDADLILKREREVVELSNGCVCCSIQSDLVAQLQTLFRSEHPPTYLLIEASGVSQPGRIASVFSYPQLRNYARLDAVVTLLDVENTDMLSDNCQQLVQAQIEAADIAVLTKTDLVAAQRVADFRERWLFPDLPSYEACKGNVPVQYLLDTGRHDPDSSALLKSNPAAGFCSQSWSSQKPFRYASFKSALAALPASVFRAKGVLHCIDFPDTRIVVQKVGSRLEFRKDGPWCGTPQTRLVAIGEDRLEQDGFLQNHMEQSLADCS
ncbi:CobW family GTP-binding protein [Phaeobacter gallaeciensis]|uniref:GTPase (G3E family) n=1 Tax=Phaeobacter gallaeciensis TaxID=60890 RepID=A0AAC9Z845_9RHOB|nr:GTP-binding protein [Phaeobacter gallaeciensis]AHD09189.1 Putative GTPase (G3E family) [Phaeobacter gallaeciensis DSM 26640]ATE92452.1 Putative GTPase (G3E family) [Phaeobacter gallaeciensis]ATE97726.1 Putative GTPase (G3E family) [Phaeobacter gallaeciensis]ATF01117.1 Putative GTPase (G3E family) [Phaeobacter gallaeciensis]ATF05497.1 Putative GTPase (G3E family) [Phaeobacter gallaeciensis]